MGGAPSVLAVVALTQFEVAIERDPAVLVSTIVGLARRGVTVSDRRPPAFVKDARGLIRRVVEVDR